jgi:putative peptide zinc metalloprotease protein
MRRLLALATTTFTLCLAIPATAGGPNNFVVASPTVDGMAIHLASVKVGTTGSKTIDSQNVAFANPHDCTGCEGIAVAYQAVIVTGNPTTVTPTNAAVAINSNCTSCGAFAYAFQYVVSADRGTHLSRAGRVRIGAVRRQANEAVDSGLPYDQLNARLESLAVEFKAAVVEDLQRSDANAQNGDQNSDVDEAPAGSQ